MKLKTNTVKLKIMKTLTFKFLLIAFFISGINCAKANYVKRIHKGWDINKVSSFQIENKFGHINFVNTRDDSVTIDVIVEIENLSGSKADYLADRINFKFSLKEGQLRAETNFSDDFKTNQNFNIVYTINIPVNRDLDVINRYGNVTLGDLKAGGNFKINYGNIQGQNLKSPENKTIKLSIQYGNASFDAINNLNAELAYSKFLADKIINAHFVSKYSVITVDKIIEVVAESQYDNFRFDEVNNLKAESKFTGWNIDKLKTSLNMNTQYGDIDIDDTSVGFEKIFIENSYGNINIGIPVEASYLLESNTYYCKVNHNQAEILTQNEDKHHNYLKAIVGKSDGKSTVTIDSKYGKVNLIK